MNDFLIPSIDLLGGRAVRLLRGDFAAVTDYGDPMRILDEWELAPGSLLHVVDLDASREGRPVHRDAVARIARLGLVVQVGGGVRTAEDALGWIEAGASRVVVGTAAARERATLAEICRAAPGNVVVAVDMRDGVVRTSGWTEEASRSAGTIVRDAEELGASAVMATDIGRDGTLSGPSLDLYRDLARSTALPVIASGGVGTLGDLVSVARAGAAGAIVGRALLDGRFTIRQAAARLEDRERPVRVIPCLDVRGGRVVKGVAFRNLRDAGDPVECARRYEREGADELVLLDVSATGEERVASLETVRAIAQSLFIPLTVGGGVRSIESFRELLAAGADRVAINTAAVEDPGLIRRAAEEFGSQAVVLACDAQHAGEGWRVVIHSGTAPRDLDAVAWCREAAALGAGEILLTALDRDGTQEGFDLELLRRTAAAGIGVIASGGAGSPAHFALAVERGGASAVLAASTFHDRILRIAEVKSALAERGIPVRAGAFAERGVA
jgi:cyclase